MLQVPIILFAIAALGGLYMAVCIFKGSFAPWALSILHALLGASGLVLILISVLQGARGLVAGALIILAIAAIGGFYLASYHVRRQLAPKSIVAIHAVVAVTGFLVLLVAAFGSGTGN